MNEKSVKSNVSVAIIKESNQKDSVIKGIDILGGVSQIINKEDNLFIKITLRAPESYPVNSSLETLTEIIKISKKAGAKRIMVGSFPDDGIDIKSLDSTLAIKSYIESLGAEFLFLDSLETSSVELNNKIIEFPRLILEADKFISINQINVDPLFSFTLSILNSYSTVSHKFQRIEKFVRNGKDYLHLEQYNQDMIQNILDIYRIKKPDLVINDLFNILESAGPYVYKESNLKHTGLIVLGTDSLATDIITLKIFQLDFLKNPLISEAHHQRLGVSDLSSIDLLGESLEDNLLSFRPCFSNLEDINTPNTAIVKGRYCSGCYKEAYRLLNFMKTNMIKDLKYISNQSFLIGDSPQEPDSPSNIILYGDCSIKSTLNHDFRKIITQSNSNLIDTIKPKLKKDSPKKEKNEKTKEKTNKSILELSGCPPNFYDCLKSYIKFYGKEIVPSAYIYDKIFSESYLPKTSKKLSNKEVPIQ
jgi:uncharacterized protein (DUF362 family)